MPQPKSFKAQKDLKVLKNSDVLQNKTITKNNGLLNFQFSVVFKLLIKPERVKQKKKPKMKGVLPLVRLLLIVLRYTYVVKPSKRVIYLRNK